MKHVVWPFYACVWMGIVGGLVYCITSSTLFKSRIKPLNIVIYVLCFISITYFRSTVTYAFSMLDLLVNMISQPLLCIICFHMRGMRLLRGTLQHFAMLIIGDLLTLPVIWALFTQEQIVGASFVYSESAIEIFLINAGMLLLEAGVLALARLLFPDKKRYETNKHMYIVRTALMLLGSLAICGFEITHVWQLYNNADAPSFSMVTERFSYVTMTALLGFIAASYITQDVKFIKMLSQNENMLKQKQIYDSILADSREFKHNIGNMLYGLEGTIMQGDMRSIVECYQEIANKYLRVNNENAAAFDRLPNAALKALLLQKLMLASERKLPIYLSVQQNLLWKCALKDTELCAVIGVLLDNAIEAAQDAVAPYVSMEIANTDNDMEVVVSNTFNRQNVDLAFINGEARSSKQGHEGLGLKSAKAAVASCKRAMMAQFRRGRYIESHLLFY